MATILTRYTPTKWNDAALIVVREAGLQSRLSGSIRISMAAAGRITTPVTMTGAALLSLVVRGAISAPAAGVSADVWLMNTSTGGHARYSDYDYNSFFRIGGSYYGCNDIGIFRLSGSTDAGTAIPWDALSGITNFGINTRKYVHNARMNMRSSGDIILREIVDEQRPVLNAIVPSDDLNGLHARRRKLPKGVKGTNWQFGLSGSDPATIRDFEVEPLATPRT